MTGNEPNITDWITAIAALLGIGPIIWGLIRLFLRDKEKEERLKYQQEQLDEFKRQTSEFQYHSTLMLQANQLLEKQVNIQTDMFLESKDIEKRKVELARQKRINDIKPYFIYHNGATGGTEFNVRLKNKGYTAESLRIEMIDTDFVNIAPFADNIRVENEADLVVTGWTNPTRTFHNAGMVNCKITFSYVDLDGNKYYQDIIKTGIGFNCTPPYTKD